MAVASAFTTNLNGPELNTSANFASNIPIAAVFVFQTNFWTFHFEGSFSSA
ncbi:MAG: hypothetical protein IPM86_03420 [Saprospiraceae bacterium]|nr:hypothetical protein [Saprospiraceae bacterium]